jgi:hypothetical protein
MSTSDKTSLLLSTTYGDRRNITIRLSNAELLGADGLSYFQTSIAERHEENAAALDFFVRLPSPGKIQGISEFKIDDAADLRSLKCVGSAARAKALRAALKAAAGLHSSCPLRPHAPLVPPHPTSPHPTPPFPLLTSQAARQRGCAPQGRSCQLAPGCHCHPAPCLLPSHPQRLPCSAVCPQ